MWTKKSQSEAIEYWEKIQSYKDDENESYLLEETLVDSFVKNGQAYLCIDTKGQKIIKFYADKLYGSFYYDEEDDELVKKMIDTIEFYELS